MNVTVCASITWLLQLPLRWLRQLQRVLLLLLFLDPLARSEAPAAASPANAAALEQQRLLRL